jgi:hypothetical protein
VIVLSCIVLSCLVFVKMVLFIMNVKERLLVLFCLALSCLYLDLGIGVRLVFSCSRLALTLA